MDNSDLAEGDICKHRSSGELLKVTGVGARYIKVIKLDGMPTEYQCEFLISASEEEKSSTKDKFHKPRPTVPGPAIKPGDVQKAVSGFTVFSEEIKNKYPGLQQALLEFWADLLAVAGNYPGGSWVMRKEESEHYCPVLRAYNSKTGRWNQFFYVLWWDKVRLEIVKGYLPPESEPLFPEKDTMYGTCHAVEMELTKFKATKQDYLDCIKDVYRMNPNPEGLA